MVRFLMLRSQDTLECHYGLASAWLHRWRTEYDQRGDDLDIAEFLKRRAKQAPNEDFHD